MIRRLLHAFNDLSIKIKLALLLIVLAFVPFVCYLLVNSWVSVRDTETQTRYTATNLLSQTAAFLQSKAIPVKNDIFAFSMEEDIQTLFNETRQRYDQDIAHWIAASTRFGAMEFPLTFNTDIRDVTLYLEKGTAETLESENFQLLSKIDANAWFHAMRQSRRQSTWLPADAFGLPGSHRQIYYIKCIRQSNDFTHLAGVIRTGVEESLFTDILNQASLTPEASVYLFNERNELLCASDSARVDHGGTSELAPHAATAVGNNAPRPWNAAPVAEVLQGLDANRLDDGMLETVRLDGRKFLYGVKKVEDTDWRLVMTIPYDDILALNVRSRNRMLLVLLFFIPVLVPIAVLAATGSTKRIRLLIAHMRQAEKGDFTMPVLPSNNDEIGELTRSFNHMLTRIAMLLDDTYKLGRENKNLELKALQAQINPHFLYNSLDLINCTAMRRKVPEIGRMVEALASFYKLSLSKGEDIVTVGSELEHVQSYLQVQNMRFQDRIHLELDVPEAIRTYSMPKIILQPLVENAIHHGIFEKDSEEGCIRIKGTLSDGIIRICVSDDGVGMSAEQLKGLLAHHTPDPFHGYGIQNIHERLQIHFGPESGLSFESTPGEGTTVTVILPAVERPRLRDAAHDPSPLHFPGEVPY